MTKDEINHNWAKWLPDGKHIVFSGNEPDHGVRFYVQDINGGKPRAFSPEGVHGTAFIVSPDGRPSPGSVLTSTVIFIPSAAARLTDTWTPTG